MDSLHQEAQPFPPGNATAPAAANMTSDGTNTYQWDAEGRMVSVNGGSTWPATYNAFGQRVERIISTAGRTEELFDPAGQLLWHLNGANGIWWEQYVQFDGRLLWYYTQATNVSRYFPVNALGSLGLATDQTGAPVEEMLHYPFGVEWVNTAGFGWDEKFARFPQHDPDLGLYETAFRQYSPGLGRWLTPDKLAGDVTNPQSLNRYAYALNDPVSYIDPSGLLWQAAPDDGTSVDNVGLLAPEASAFPSSGSGGGGGADPLTVTLKNQFTLTARQVMSLVAANNQSDFCNELIDCIVFRESPGNGGFYTHAVPIRHGQLLSTERGLMQVNRGGAAWVAGAYEGYPSAGALYDQLFDPATNIQVGSDLLQLHVDAAGGNLRQGLINYGTGASSYANSILDCVQKLQQGNIQGAIGAAHGTQ